MPHPISYKLLALVILFTCFFLAVKSAPLTPETLHQIRRVGDFTVNSLGDVVYNVREWDPIENEVTTNLQILYAEADDPYPLTYSEGNHDGNPQFTTDESYVLFLSDRSGSSQVWAVPVNGTEDDVVQISTFPVNIDNLLAFTTVEGDYLLYTIQVYPECADLQCTANNDAEVAARGPNTWRYYTELFVRHWDQWLTGKMSHIFVQKISVQKGQPPTLIGTPLDLMNGLQIYSPVPPFGGLEQIDVSPDGKQIAFTAEIAESSRAWTTGWKIYTVPTDGSSAPICITNFTSARTTNPRYSPDATSIAFLAMDRPGFEADKLHVNVMSRDTGKITPWTSQIDISFSDIRYDDSGDFLIGDADYMGSHSFFAIPTSGNPPTTLQQLPITGTCQEIFSVISTDTFIFSRQSMTAPVDLWLLSANISGGQFHVVSVEQLTGENDEILEDVQMSVPQRFSFIGSNSDKVYGWVVPPYQQSPGKQYPVANLVHGGPQGSWLDNWSYRWNPQLWAGHGYGVIMIDFHGSTGYGQAFTDSISGNWGSLPYWDVMNGTFAALAQFPYLDKTNVGALGASYGGYMINWIHGQNDFFKALVTHDGIFDTFLGYYSTEELWFPEWEFRGVPWENPDLYAKWNPASYVQNWKIPHLIIHGGRDYRLTLSHGIGAFNALQRKGIPSAFLEFDLENHWVLNDENGIKWYDVVLRWLDVYLRNYTK